MDRPNVEGIPLDAGEEGGENGVELGRNRVGLGRIEPIDLFYRPVSVSSGHQKKKQTRILVLWNVALKPKGKGSP